MSDMLLQNRISSNWHNHDVQISFNRANYLQRDYVFFWLEALLREVERLLWWLLM